MTLTELITGIDWTAIITAIATLITTIAGVIAGIQTKGKYDAKKEAESLEYELEQTQAFFDPDDTSVMTPPPSTPERSWKMPESVKTFMLAGHSDEEKVSILQQVEDAEESGYVDYTISYPGGYYKISYGQINGGGTYAK